MPQNQNGSKCSYLKKFAKNCFFICKAVGTVIIAVSFLLFISTFTMKSIGNVQIIYIEAQRPSLYKVNVKFLSIGLDSSIIAEDFKNFNMTDSKLIKLVKHLYPAYLRIGGNLADKLIFNSTLKEPDKGIKQFYRDSSYYNIFYETRFLPNYIMTGFRWLTFMKFAEKTKLDVIFDINSLRRFQNGSWDYRNAESLIKYSSDHGLWLNWELGNEPNSFLHKFNKAVNASQMAKDFQVLKHLLKQYSLYKDSLLLGPDTTRPREKHKQSEIYLREFLKNAANVIDAITWHQYYFNGRTAKAQDFLNPHIFDYLKNQIDVVNNITQTLNIQSKAVWLGETSSAYGGGAPNLSNTFIGSFIWIDKLGLAAKMGIDVVIRQSIFKGYYALLDDNYDPNPDWWISVLYKKLVGRKVVPNYTACLKKVRLYCHCTKRTIRGLPSVTVFGINLDNDIAYIRIEGLFPFEIEEDLTTNVYAFELTSDNSLYSKGVRLNGKLLQLSSDNSLPKIVPKLLELKPFVTMPPFSIVFWVIPTPYVKACL